MDTITHAQLRALAESGAPPAVSLFVPTHRKGSGIRQDPIEFKNLLREAETRLAAGGMRPTEAHDLLRPAWDLLDDANVWGPEGLDGLAVFVAPMIFQAYHLPFAPEPMVHVNDRFYVKALLPILRDQEFYVLSISKHDARLLRCTRTSCERIELPKDVETNVEKVREGKGEHAGATVRHSDGLGGSGAGQGAAGTFHGESTEIERRLAEDMRFTFRQVDDGVRRVIDNPEAPFVLAGDIHVTPVYREISKLKNVVEETIRGNQDIAPDAEIHAKALEILGPVWHRALNAEQETFGTALAQGKASRDVEEILVAAMDGRVNTLFVAPEERRWGHVDETRRSVELHDAERPGDEDVLDWATLKTLQTSGRVLVVNREQIPGDGPLAAILRY